MIRVRSEHTTFKQPVFDFKRMPPFFGWMRLLVTMGRGCDFVGSLGRVTFVQSYSSTVLTVYNPF